MTPPEFVATCSQRGIRLQVVGDKIRATGTPPPKPEVFAAYLRAHKPALFELLVERPASGTPGGLVSPWRRNVTDWSGADPASNRPDPDSPRYPQLGTDVPPVDSVWAEESVTELVLRGVDAVGFAEAHGVEVPAMDEAMGDVLSSRRIVDLVVAARANRLPHQHPPLRVSSGRLVGDPNVAVRGMLDWIRFALRRGADKSLHLLAVRDAVDLLDLDLVLALRE